MIQITRRTFLIGTAAALAAVAIPGAGAAAYDSWMQVPKLAPGPYTFSIHWLPSEAKELRLLADGKRVEQIDVDMGGGWTQSSISFDVDTRPVEVSFELEGKQVDTRYFSLQLRAKIETGNRATSYIPNKAVSAPTNHALYSDTPNASWRKSQKGMIKQKSPSHC